MKRHTCGWLAGLVAAFILLMTGAAAAQEGIRMEAFASPVSSALESRVLLQIPSALMGENARLTLAPGSGSEWTVDERFVAQDWRFSVVESSLRFELSDGEKRYLFEADHSIGADTVVYQCRELSGKEIQATRNADGKWTVVFSFDLSGYREAQVTVSLALETDWAALPEGEVYRGIHPLSSADWSVGDTSWQFPLTESGFVSLPLPVEVKVETKAPVLEKGDAMFVLTDGDGNIVSQAPCGEDGRAVFALRPVLPRMEDGRQWTIRQLEQTGGGLTADSTRYALRLSTSPWEWNGQEWQSVREAVLTRLGEQGEEEMGTAEESRDGALVARSWTSSDAAAPLVCVFENPYAAAGECTVEGKVLLPGRYNTAWEDEFALTLSENGQVIGRAKTVSGGAFAFPALRYGAEDVGEHVYTVTQEEGNVGGVEYDLAAHEVRVMVTDLGHGVLEAVQAEPLEIVNGYAAYGSLDLPVASVLTGKDMTDGEFVYGLFDGETLVAEQASDENGLAVFHLDYTLKDVREGMGAAHRSSRRAYTLRLTNGDALPAGIVPDAGEIPVWVTLTENGLGKINASFIPEASSLTFTHVYKATGRIMVEGFLSLTQGQLREGQFSFDILEGDRLVSSTVNREDGLLVFPDIVYHAGDEGEHTYTVRQDLSIASGVRMDETVYTLNAQVKDNGDGTMQADYVVLDSPNGRLTFENGYQASGSVSLSFDIDLVGREIREGEFSFRLYENSTLLQEAWADPAGHVAFERIEYGVRDIGTHTYVVRPGEMPAFSVESDRNGFNIVVEVSDNGRGQLSAFLRNRPDSFAFVYTPFGTYQLEAYVSLKGRDLREGEMTFYILDGENRPVSSGKNDLSGRIVFEPLEYSRKDLGATRKYTVVQSQEVPSGVTRDGTQYQMEVHVSDNGDGTLNATCDRMKFLSFSCTYNAEGIYTPDVRVELKDAALREGQFTFEMVEYGKIVKTQANSPDGTVAFRPFAYTIADVGTHTYTVRQVGTPASGIEMDRSMQPLTVTVSDNGDGTLQIQAQKDPVVFVNRYLTRGTLMLSSSVSLSGKPLTEGAFAVRIMKDGKLLAEGQNDAAGKVVLSPMVFDNEDLRSSDGALTEKGTLEMKAVLENMGESGGIQADRTEIPFKVFLTDRGDGHMEASASAGAGDLAFSAVYSARGELKCGAWVLLDGKTPAAGTFRAGLFEKDTLVAEAENGPDGRFEFPPVEYTLADTGEHACVIRLTACPGEVIPDPRQAEGTAVVTDTGRGVLEVTWNGEERTFETRSAQTGGMETALRVLLEGRPARAEDAGFLLKEGENVVSTALTDADGYARFAPVHYREEDVGEHQYTVEAGSTAPGVTLEDVDHTWTVHVEKNAAGEIAWYTDESLIPEFRAAYRTSGEIAIEAGVTLQGRPLEEGLFTLALFKGETRLQEKAADASGRVVFDPLSYTNEDVGTHVYRVMLTDADRPGYTLDRAEKEVRVSVTDDQNGTLTALEEEVPVFANRYEAEGTFLPEARVTLTGRALKEGEFTFALLSEGAVLDEKTNDASGRVVFDPLVFGAEDAGERFYEVRALNGDGNGLKLESDGSFPLTLEVRDDGKGTMEIACGGEAAFQYAYEAKGALRIAVHAKLSGREAKAGEFVYELLRDGEVLSSAAADAEGVCVFEEIPFTAAGTADYLVRLAGGLPGGVQGPEEASLEVNAVDDGKGNIVFDVLPPLPCAFNYLYAPTGTAAFAFRVVSALPMAGGEYLVSVTDERGRTYTAVNEADGSVLFNPIVYSLEDVGEHTYTVRQEKGDLGGVVYDETVYRVPVRVTEEADGRLSCSFHTGNIVFVNGYRASGTWTCRAKVNLKGMDPEKAGVTLTLTQDGQAVSEASVDEDGSAVFAPVTFTQEDAGTREYRIYASSRMYSRLVSDEEGTPVRVTVEDQGDGTLRFIEGPVPEVSLSYESAGHASIEVMALLEGRPVRAEEFRFALYEGNTLLDTARADETGRAAFEVFYETGEEGSHTYTIRQLTPDAQNVRWEDKPLEVQALVEDAGNGEMNVTLTYPEGGAVYRNLYTATGSVQVRGSVTLTGKQLKEGQFAFGLYRDDTLLSRAFNDADGNVVFPDVELTRDDGDIVAFEVSQIPGNEAGITYDETAYPVLVRILDSGDGVLTASYAALPAFRNSYGAAGEAVLSARINLVGRKLAAGSFSVTLSENGKVLQEKQNDEEGTVLFDPLVYTLNDVGVHVYEAHESSTQENGVPLETESREIRVEVADDGSGRLKVSVSGNSPEFKNIYTAQTPLTVRARVMGIVPEMEKTVHLTLKDAGGNELQTIEAGNGVHSFSPLLFTQDDTGKQFVYIVTCADVETAYTLRATVSEGKDGGLDVATEILGPEGPVDSIQFVIEQTVSLTVRASGAEEAVRFTVVLEQDGSRLKGDYPVEGAAESSVISGGKITLDRNGAAVIRGLPYGCSYQVTCDAVPRYEATAESASGVLKKQGTCDFDLKLARTTFAVKSIWYDEEGNRKEETVDADRWTLYADGQETGYVFRFNGSEYIVEGLTLGGAQGGETVYSAKLTPPDNTEVTYMNAGVHEDETDALYKNGVAVVRDGATFRVRIRFSAGTDEEGVPMYTYRPVTGTLYREDGQTVSVTMNPDENGWCVLSDIDKEQEYYLIPSGVEGYTAVYRNSREYGNVTTRVYDGGTVTFAPGHQGPGRGQILTYAGIGAGVLAIGAAVAALARRRKKRSSSGEQDS